MGLALRALSWPCSAAVAARAGPCIRPSPVFELSFDVAFSAEGPEERTMSRFNSLALLCACACHTRIDPCQAPGQREIENGKPQRNQHRWIIDNRDT